MVDSYVKKVGSGFSRQFSSAKRPNQLLPFQRKLSVERPITYHPPHPRISSLFRTPAAITKRESPPSLQRCHEPFIRVNTTGRFRRRYDPLRVEAFADAFGDAKQEEQQNRLGQEDEEDEESHVGSSNESQPDMTHFTNHDNHDDTARLRHDSDDRRLQLTKHPANALNAYKRTSTQTSSGLPKLHPRSRSTRYSIVVFGL